MDAVAYAALPRVVLDNGSGNLKFSLASSKKPPTVMPNCIGQPKRKFTSQSFSADTSHSSPSDPLSYAEHGESIGDACYTLWEYFCLRPWADGLLYEPNRQRTIWNKIMGRPHIKINGVPANMLAIAPANAALCITEPNMAPGMCRQTLAELIFEDLGFSLAAIMSSQAASNWYYSVAKNPASGAASDAKLTAYPSASAAPASLPPDTACCLVVDCGFGSSHCVPFANGKPIQRAALRNGLAGSHLNAYLKNVSAIRTINLEFNELLVQHMKEEACYVSADFNLEMRAARQLRRIKGSSWLTHDYVLPTYGGKSKSHLHRHFNNHSVSAPPLLTDERRPVVERLARGATLTPEDLEAIVPQQSADHANGDQTAENNRADGQTNGDMQNTLEAANIIAEETAKEDKKANNHVVGLFNERFAIPELLFSPQDLRLNECGIAELALRSIALAPTCLQRYLAENVLLTGGSTKFPGFTERFYSELRAMLPADWNLQIYSAEDRALTAFYGARLYARDDTAFLETAVTRNFYLEHGGIYPHR
ncbi:actin-related, putative [Babesia bigemina]|uniref:Actin-related, putative n=1 Tax=Babesia bigemina TaxID=5866 RepID=A0A061D507_BABBI|nr:actin-related, putative [Babesia bigemina]CDR95771.1 actin-related, putative [Babesia bigemina]|eukprot:XP_012767957.1 actin-related, putative [Babesia bigemina]